MSLHPLKRSAVLLALLAQAFFAPGFVSSQERAPLVPFTKERPPRGPSVEPEPQPALQGTIRTITVTRKNVFATGTDMDRRFPYALANKVHIVTKEDVIRNDLLFREGDAYNDELLRESERILRTRGIYRYVRITPTMSADGGVDVLVETEDVWTTAIQLSYGTAGGEQFYRVGFLEQNFLGRGKAVGAFVRQDIDRTVRGLSYRDPRLFSSRWNFFTGYGKDEKGREWVTSLERPYYSVTVPHSEGGEFRLLEDEDRMFENGEEVATFHHKSKDDRVFASYALNRSYDRVRRVTLIQLREKDEFGDVRGPQAPVLPEERIVSAIQAGYEFKNTDYVKERGVVTFDRDEDINRGWEWSVEAGPSLKDLGATRDGSIGRAEVRKIFNPRRGQLWFNYLNLDGRYENGELADGVLRYRTQYFWSNWLPEHTASVRVQLVASQNLDPESQFLVGGESGLRGYSVRQFSGTKTALVTLENRRVVLYDWLNLLSVGWAVFADTGGAWEEHEQPRFAGFMSDVGAGIRFAPSRSVNPGLIRVDLAYALQDNNRSSRLVINIGADVHFGKPRDRKFDQ